MRHHHDGDRFAGITAALDHAFDGYLFARQMSGDVRQHTGHIAHIESKIIAADMRIGRCGWERPQILRWAAECRAAFAARDIYDVGNHGRRGWFFASAAAFEREW